MIMRVHLLHDPVGLVIEKFGWAYWNLDLRASRRRGSRTAGNQVSRKAARRVAVDPREQVAGESLGVLFLNLDCLDNFAMPKDGNGHVRPLGKDVRVSMGNAELPIGTKKAGIGVSAGNMHISLRMCGAPDSSNATAVMAVESRRPVLNMMFPEACNPASAAFCDAPDATSISLLLPRQPANGVSAGDRWSCPGAASALCRPGCPVARQCMPAGLIPQPARRIFGGAVEIAGLVPDETTARKSPVVAAAEEMKSPVAFGMTRPRAKRAVLLQRRRLWSRAGVLSGACQNMSECPSVRRWIGDEVGKAVVDLLVLRPDRWVKTGGKR